MDADGGISYDIRKLKAMLTRAIGIVTSSKNEDITTSTIMDCKNLCDLLDKRFHKLEEAIEEAAVCREDPKKLYDSLDEYQGRYMEARKAVRARLHEAETSFDNGTKKHEKERKRETRLDKSLKPFVLTKAHSPTDLRLWIKQIEEYFHSGGLDRSADLNEEDIKNQRAHLSRSLDVEMLKMLDQRTTSSTPVFGNEGCLKVIREIFMILYPIFYRRMTLFQIRQSGEGNTSYLERINRTSMEAELDTLDREAFCLLHFVVTLEDEKLRKKIVALENPTYIAASKLVAKYDTTLISTKAIKKQQHSPDAMAAFVNNGRTNHGNKPNYTNQRSTQANPKRQCIRCGRTGHDSNQCGVLVKGLNCKSCGKKGHLAVVCRSTPMNTSNHMRTYVRGDDNSHEEEEDDITANIHPEVTPRLDTLITHSQGEFTFKAFPDSGGCTTMMASDLAKREGIEINYNVKTPKFVAVNGAELKIDGVAILRVKNQNNDVTKTIAVIISPDVRNDFIIGYPQLKKLNVISEKFPVAAYSINNTNEFEKLKSFICDDYPETIRDSLPDTSMHGPPPR